jgi:hypothetical protein
MKFLVPIAENNIRAWLDDKPWQWSQIVITRTSLRAVFALGYSSELWLDIHALTQFRALSLGWTACNWPKLNLMEASVNETVEAANEAAIETVSDFAGAASSAAHAAHAALFAAPDLAASNAGIIMDSSVPEVEFDNINRDFDWLENHHQQTQAARRLSRIGLWLDQGAKGWEPGWYKTRSALLSIDLNYSVWIDWYERRIRGERAAFDIPGDKGRVEDKKILRRLAEATDEDFWGKGHEYVNATLKGWLDEARARVAPPPIMAEASGEFDLTGDAAGTVQEPPTPSQNRNAISFRADEDGKISVDASASVDQLRRDAEARDRHSEAASEAQTVLNRCRGNNAAARLTLRLENYLAAIGASIEDAKPSLIVQRGEKLRQELAAYAAPDTLLDPIADDILVDLKGWQSSHNMMVGLDPVLMAIDTSMLGPDRRPALVSPDEIKQFAHDAQEADLLAEGTEEIIIEAADLAPAIPDTNDRRTNASIEMVRNLCIETVSIVLNYPGKSAVAATVISGIVSPILVGGVAAPISIMSSIKAAEYLVVHRQWIEEKMGNTPTWRALLIKVADWLGKNTPFTPK